ncbi:hypothetical protein [Helicobacter cetorum]|uniref:Uncharacterized protein n=1 Tax=Helicobacter cetorum (strain ATCC BAA-540 / CCUG 52418 / MIT 99-5656) TaxID=1163745 RepID=I0EQJ4_HELCM|nr:hypothetical protein [Helicobacter cetorum]AFI05213.1 hypothetical protein HCD_00905 [Helicobacter cetorum MIT 99-5656]AFI06011.1 hypothetical protein HCD_05045 [Helicobacter cetorum MIT 99-5656]
MAIYLNAFKFLAPYIVALVLFFMVLHLKTHNAILKEKLSQTNATIKLQNDSIEKLKQSRQEYLKTKQKTIIKIQDKYIKIPINNSTCEKELKSFKDILGAF